MHYIWILCICQRVRALYFIGPHTFFIRKYTRDKINLSIFSFLVSFRWLDFVCECCYVLCVYYVCTKQSQQLNWKNSLPDTLTYTIRNFRIIKNKTILQSTTYPQFHIHTVPTITITENFQSNLCAFRLSKSVAKHRFLV